MWPAEHQVARIQYKGISTNIDTDLEAGEADGEVSEVHEQWSTFDKIPGNEQKDIRIYKNFFVKRYKDPDIATNEEKMQKKAAFVKVKLHKSADEEYSYLFQTLLQDPESLDQFIKKINIIQYVKNRFINSGI